MNCDVMIWTYFSGHEECDFRTREDSEKLSDAVAVAFRDRDSEHWLVIRQLKVFRNGRLHRKLVR